MRMAFWKKLFGDDDPRRVDYYREGADLLREGKAHEALTSFRLALKEAPGDTVIVQVMTSFFWNREPVSEASSSPRREPDTVQS